MRRLHESVLLAFERAGQGRAGVHAAVAAAFEVEADNIEQTADRLARTLPRVQGVNREILTNEVLTYQTIAQWLRTRALLVRADVSPLLSDDPEGSTHPPAPASATAAQTDPTTTPSEPDAQIGDRAMADQPAPTPNDRIDAFTLVIGDLHRRREHGIATYGTALQAFNGRNTGRDAYEEVLDLAVYIRTLRDELDEICAQGRAVVVAWRSDSDKAIGEEIDVLDRLLGATGR